MAGGPILIPRHCGGWLALSPEHASVRIGVTALTEEEARALFELRMESWLASLYEARPSHPHPDQ